MGVNVGDTDVAGSDGTVEDCVMLWRRRFIDRATAELESRLAAIEEQYPQPRSRRDSRLVRRARAKPMRKHLLSQLRVPWFMTDRP